MRVSAQLFGLLFGASYCYATGRSRRFSEAPVYDTGDGAGGGNFNTNNAFGAVDLPPLGGQDDYNYGQGHLDPTMYGGGGYEQQQHQNVGMASAYALPPGAHLPGGYHDQHLHYPPAQPMMYQPQYDEYSSDATSRWMPQYTQDWQQIPQQQQVQAEPRPWDSFKPEIFESSMPARSSRFELPPDAMQADDSTRPKRGSRKGREQAENALDNMSRRTAAMNLGGLAPIHTGSQAGEGSRRRGKEVARHSREPQTARLATTARMYDDDEVNVTERPKPVRPKTARLTTQKRQVRDWVRSLVENQWAIRKLDCDLFTPEQMAAQIAEIKLDNPGFEVAITNDAITMIERHVGTGSDYVSRYRKMGDKYTDRMSYLKRKYTALGKWTPEEVDAAVREEFRKVGTRRLTGPKKKSYVSGDNEQEEQQNNQITIAEEVWDDFTARLLGPAVNEGRQMCMSLIGSLAELYTHDDYDHQTSRDYLVMYLREVQRVSDREIAEMDQVGSSAAPTPSGKGKGKSKSRWFG